jgi:hypothetical protein
LYRVTHNSFVATTGAPIAFVALSVTPVTVGLSAPLIPFNVTFSNATEKQKHLVFMSAEFVHAGHPLPTVTAAFCNPPTPLAATSFTGDKLSTTSTFTNPDSSFFHASGLIGSESGPITAPTDVTVTTGAVVSNVTCCVATYPIPASGQPATTVFSPSMPPIINVPP